MSGGLGCGRGHNPIRCIKHSKRGRPPAATLTTVSPRQPPIHNHYSVIKAGRGQSSALADGDKSLSWGKPPAGQLPSSIYRTLLLAHLVLVPA